MTVLEQVKDYLKVTWPDEDGAIQQLIDRGKAELNELAGAALDFDSEGLARSLLFDHVRYGYNNASEYFEQNFKEKILRLQLKTGVSLLPEDDADET